ASGHLTYWMEAQGAHVTAFEVGYDAKIHMIPPVDDSNLEAAQLGLMKHTSRTTNAWWFLHREHQSSARLVHGDIYSLPDDLGQYDVVVLGSILLHVRDAFRALQQAVNCASDIVVLTDVAHVGLDGDEPLLQFGGSDVVNPEPSVTWWRLSPGAV